MAAGVDVCPGNIKPPPGILHHDVKQSNPETEADVKQSNTGPRKKNARRGTRGRKPRDRATPCDPKLDTIFDEFKAVEQNNPHTQEADTSLATQMEDTPEEIPLTEHQLARLIGKSVNDWLNPITQA